MSDIDKQELNEKTLPFFMRYLEEQGYQDLSDEESSSVRGGYVGKLVTAKYPSDNEDVGGGRFVTLKYPSDNEDICTSTLQ